MATTEIIFDAFRQEWKLGKIFVKTLIFNATSIEKHKSLNKHDLKVHPIILANNIQFPT